MTATEEPSSAAHDARLRLRQAGLRVTRPRVTVLTAVAVGDHATVDTIAAHVRTELGAVSTQAVYDVLRTFTEHGLVRRIEPAGSPARFEARVGDNHHHLICRSCRRVVDVDCVVGHSACLTPSDAHGFEVDEAEVVFWGSCPTCTDNTPVPREHTALEATR